MTTPRRPGRPRTKPAEERRDDLLNAAERLFHDQGFALTSVDQITRAAGVAKGTFYLYFTTKEDVRAALAERSARRQIDALERALAAAPDRPIEAWVEAYAALPREETASAPIVEHLAAVLDPMSDEPHALAVFLFNGVQADAEDPSFDRARLAEWARLLCGKPRPTPPPKLKKPELRQGSLF